MNSDKSNSVLIAVREAPFRKIVLGPQFPEQESIIKYSKECPNALIVDDHVYNFDYVFNSKVPQSTFYDALIHPLVLKVLSGYDCTVLAYGQTGTGKSYSMGMSVEEMRHEQLGVLPRCLNDMLARLSELEQQKENVLPVLSASFIEIYNEKAYDLLALNTVEPIASRGQRRFTGGTCKPLKTQQDLQELLLMGIKNRHVRPTNMNVNSSRSHAIVTIHYKRGLRHARLNMVDLAGSEGVRRTGHEGMARTEGVYINMGLLGINKVLLSMSAGHTIIPYRDTILTTVLKESLNADAYLTLLACVSPHSSDMSETNSTLRFAESAKRVKLAPQLSHQLQQLQQQVRSAKKKTINATPQWLHRVLPSSTAIKRPVVVRYQGGPATRNSFCTPDKRPIKTLQRYHSEMGLSPSVKERTRALLMLQVEPEVEALPSVIFRPPKAVTETGMDLVHRPAPTNVPPGLEQKSCSHELVGLQTPMPPSMSDFMQLKAQYDALKQENERLIQQQVEASEPQLSLLSYSQFSSELGSIAEENDQTNTKDCKLFNSSPVLIPKERRLSSLHTPTASNEPAIPEPAKNRRRSMRLMCRQFSINVINNNVKEEAQRRRSLRIALQSQTKITAVTEQPSISQAKSLSGRRTVNKVSELSEMLSRQLIGANSQNARLRKHRAQLLEFLNKASLKDLQKLPCIGPKTSFELVMHRSVMGQFKNWKQVERLPIWKGNKYSSFAVANCIEIFQ